MTFYEQMVPAFSALLEKGVTLQAPVYGTLLQSRVPFRNIPKTKVRKSLFPLQYILRIYLTDGDMIKFRISKKLYGFAT